MAIMVMPYDGATYGFPREMPENLEATGFADWLVENGYPLSNIQGDMPGFPAGTSFFCVIYDDQNTADPNNPNNPNYTDPYTYTPPPASE